MYTSLLERHFAIWAISVRLPDRHFTALYALAFHSILHTADFKDKSENSWAEKFRASIWTWVLSFNKFSGSIPCLVTFSHFCLKNYSSFYSNFSEIIVFEEIFYRYFQLTPLNLPLFEEFHWSFKFAKYRMGWKAIAFNAGMCLPGNHTETA